MTDTPPTGNFAHFSLKICQVLTLMIPVMVFIGKAPVDIACILIALIFLAVHIQRKDFSWARPVWVRVVLGYWAFLMIHSLFAPDPVLALDRAIPWGRYPFFAIALCHWIIRDRTFSHKLLISMGIGAALLCGDTLLQFFTGTDIRGFEKAAEDRLTGPFNQPRIGYTLTWMVFPVILTCLDWRRQAWVKSAFKAVGAALLCLAIIASGERTPTLLLLMGLALTGLLLPTLRRKLLWLGPLVVLMIGAFLYTNPVMYERQVISTKNTIAHYWESPYGKLTLDAMDNIRANPIFGIGVQHYRVVNGIGTKAREPQPHPHNFYLEMWVETGIFGLMGLITIFSCWVYHFVRHYGAWRGDFLLTGLVVGILIRLWPIIANPSFYSSWNVIPMWLMVGWYFALINKPHPTPTS